MSNLTFYYNIVEKAIAKIGLDPKTCRMKDAGKWTLTNEGIPIWIDVVFLQNNHRPYFRVAAPVLQMTKENMTEVAVDLMYTNFDLFGVAMSANKKTGKVYIKTIRETEGLDVNEAHSMILRIGNYALQHTKILTEKFGQPAASSFPHAPQNAEA